MKTLPDTLYSAAQVRELDRIAIEEMGIPGRVLMERAGSVAFERLRERWPAARRLVLFCGGGNNGGDGLVIARLARAAGLEPVAYLLAEPERLRGDAAANYDAALAAGVRIEPWRGAAPEPCDLVADALLGTGLAGEVQGSARAAIAAMNHARVPVLAVDIPSGLSADSGAVLGEAVQASATVTFIGLKQGLFTGAGPRCCGEIAFDDLAVPASVYRRLPSAARRLHADALAAALPRRPRDAHKGQHGHVLVIGGERGMAGAVRLAGEAALRCGAGLVSVATRAAHATALAAARPELMCHGVESPAELAPLLQRADVVAVGPGLGQGDWGRAMLGKVLESDAVLVVDADGLNLLAVEPQWRATWVLTPHPGEAGRLLGMSAAEVQADRFAAVASLEASYGGVCLLKGAGTLVTNEAGVPALCCAGNPGMAVGGMGDLLTGVIAAFIAQGMTLRAAAEAGVLVHALAGDAAAVDGERGLLPTDLLPHLRRLANPR